MTKITTFLLLISSFLSFAQKEAKIPRKISKSPTELAQYLVVGARTKQEKVDTIYNWVIRNIDYDHEKSSSGDPFFYEDESKVLKSNIGTCTGYSNLVKAMLNEVGVKSEVIYGYVHDELIDSLTVPMECTHAWLAIEMDAKWCLADPTWDAGYVGNIETNKVEKYKNKWSKLTSKYDNADAKLEEKKIAKPHKGESYISKQKKCKERRSKATDKLKRKEHNAKDFTGDHGFVRDPGDAWYLVSPDSFLVSHLPANPMWQLMERPVTIENFAQIKINGNTVLSISEELKLEDLDFESEIRRYTRLDYLERLKWSAEDAVIYNPINYQMLAQNYYNWLTIMGDDEFQDAAGDKHKVNSFRELLGDIDSLKAYSKLAKVNAKIEYRYTSSTYKKMYKDEVSVRKDQAKVIFKGLKENKKTLEDAEENIERLEKNFKKMTEKVAKLDENSSSKSLFSDKDAVQNFTDSLERLTQRFEVKTALWKRALDSTYLQNVYNSLWQSLNLLGAKSYYLEIKNYATAQHIREVDSLLNDELAELKSLYTDSIPIEMFGKPMYRDVQEIYAFLAYVRPQIEDMKSSKQIASAKKIMGYYNSEVQQQLESYVKMSKRAYGHCKWMTNILKDFDKLWQEAEEDILDQERLIEERFEFIHEVIESKKSRNEKFYTMISESSKAWKSDFKNK